MENSMDIDNTVYVQELKAVLVCEQSDGYLKMWAKERLEEIQYQVEFIPPPTKILVAA